jgi:hypothetical protein
LEEFQVEKANLSPAAQTYFQPDTPANLKLLIARGTVPLPPRELVILQFHFQNDPDAEVSAGAAQSLTSIPSNILRTILGGDIPGAILNFFSSRLLGNRELLETLIINRRTPDETVAFLAASEKDEYILELIANNQERVLRYAVIAREIFQNRHAPRTVKERLKSFLKTTFPIKGGEVVEPVPEPILAPAAPAAPEPVVSEAEALSLDEKIAPPSLAAETAAAPEAAPAAPAVPTPPGLAPGQAGVVGVEGEWKDMIELTEELSKIKLPQELTEENQREVTEEERKSLSVRILLMSVSEKIKLALLGNKEARTILIRDSNKMVSASVVKSPKVQDDEIVKIAQMRGVADEVLRMVASNKEWTKNYAVKKALVENPKTPVQASFRFLSLLRESDIKNIARSKNVPSAVAAQAKRLVQQKEKGPGKH